MEQEQASIVDRPSPALSHLFSLLVLPTAPWRLASLIVAH